jgi:hypothetical protein
LKPFIKDSNKRFVVSWFLENRFPVIAAIQRVVDHARFVGSFMTGHGNTLKS